MFWLNNRRYDHVWSHLVGLTCISEAFLQNELPTNITAKLWLRDYTLGFLKHTEWSYL